MGKIGNILYGLLWIAYMLFGFFYYPRFNANVAFPCLIIVAVGAWKHGIQFGLLGCLVSLPYHFFLFDYYAEIHIFYQGHFFGTLFLVVVALISGSLKEFRDRIKQNSFILEQKVAERTGELNHLIEQLIKDDENIRRSLGQDIHDGLGQNLTGLLLYSSSIHEDMKNNNSTALPQMEEMLENVNKCLHLARKVSRTLFPIKIMETGFDVALDELISYFTETTEVEFDIRLDGSEQHLSGSIVLHFYRIVYESILNTISNDTPSHIRITLQLENGGCCLSMRIYGCLDPEIICNNMFVMLMRYRARLVSGKLTVAITDTREILINCKVPDNRLNEKQTHMLTHHE